ncbi:putative ABC transporter permease protein [Gordonia hirsuta DSM 44140 = NBRC 16056]|uniref:Putative ABC transporter permease protein n=1 Tax=Gordonia hirsuta DSM 44140 = NBRC 16056 TaxID=1121927 RepID=L7L6J0_9ACTN|nr:sugar ABC transporter permease [Gordonia hirsuta]GAC56770.1 putative ABC transporter permease protein [Gordonia hirsuta DSM 44140 = NBRC 16056]
MTSEDDELTPEEPNTDAPTSDLSAPDPVSSDDIEAIPPEPVAPIHSDLWVPPEAMAPAPGSERPLTGQPLAAPPPAEYPADYPHDGPGAEVYAATLPGAAVPESVVPGSAVATAPAPVAATTAPKRSRATARKSSERRLAYWLVAPAAIVMLLVTGYPIVYAFWLSLNRATLTAPDENEFIGLSNYVTVLSDGYWWSALWVTAFITVVSVVIELILGMMIALVMHRTLFGKGTIRTVVLIPYGIVTVAAAFSWYYAWTPGTGYLANLVPDGTDLLTQQWPSIFIIILAEVWKTTPFMALLLLAGLALVPDDLLKAAQIDGAGAWTRLWKIIIPMMKAAILVALLFRTLDAFRIFDNIYILTKGNNGTGSVSMLGYNNLFKAFNLGVGSAISVLIFLCVAIIAFVFIKIFGASAPGSDDEGR